jgi:hypothetical protein
VNYKTAIDVATAFVSDVDGQSGMNAFFSAGFFATTGSIQQPLTSNTAAVNAIFTTTSYTGGTTCSSVPFVSCANTLTDQFLS